ncbi:MAG TPA: SusC/RagA family TonB-linked outer membrane protein [Cyclobacteriaceae bacterium]|nr:SusC/RagA family TonB-linked outer membrane protein [Cyclobacteriaceae bacterium]
MTKPVSKTALTPVFILTLCSIGTVYAQETAFRVPPKKNTQNTPDTHKGEKELTDILVQLELIYDVTFAYQKKFLSGKYAMYRPLLETDLDAYLKEILQPQKLGFKKVGNEDEKIYVIYPLEEAITLSPLPLPGTQKESVQDVAATTTIVQGLVKDNADGIPVAGASVVLKGTMIGTITDTEGKFSIEVPVNTKNKLVFSYIGFSKKECEITGNGDFVQVLLDENLQPLAEVVVTALGIKRDQKAIGYSVTTIGNNQLVVSGNTNFASALYGKIPGVRIRTAPGGATSAVTIQIRGFNSLNYNTQPLYIIDGVPMRDANERGSEGVNNDDYFIDQRLRGNGILDINPADIETLTALKGASATALYGSDASNGAVVITTKKGMKKVGMGVDVGYNFSVEKVAFTPRYQNVYGPGFDRETNLANGATADGWVPVDTNNDGISDSKRPLFMAYGQFGPKMEGQNVLWWDGTTKKYSPQPNNYKDFYRTGHNSQFNVALHNQVGKIGYRFSYSRNDYEGIQVGGKMMKNIINFNSTIKLTNRLRVDWMMNFTNSFVHNRPYKINRLTDSYTGFFSRAEKMSLFFDKYRTSEGFKWVPYDQAQRNPEEALKYTTPSGYEVMDLLWKQLRNSEDETQNRLISSFTVNYDITKDLQMRARVGNDITGIGIESKQYNEYQTIFNGASSTGLYGTSTGHYSILYADALLSYSKNLNTDFTMSLNGGLQVRDERYRDRLVSTTGGLAIANQFNFSNSYNPDLTRVKSNTSILKYAYVGIASFSYKNILFVEGTGRQEYSSTLPPGHNSYFYPSLNSGFIFSDALQMPSFFNYGKLRASYGVVGNSPPVYEANVIYNLTSLATANGATVAANPNGALYGNNSIRPERKYEFEFGLETRMFHNKVGIDITYYNNRIKDQILKQDLPTSTGADKILTNVGELQGHGFEVGLSTMILNGVFKWNAILNSAYSTTKVYKLINGVNQLVFRDMEGSAIRVVSEKGQAIGNVYVYPRKTDGNGNFIINSDGLYVIDKTRYVKSGNLLPKATGGISNVFSYKAFNLNVAIDYSLGGKIISVPLKYATGAGMYESTLKYRDAKHGGLSYYVNSSGDMIQLDNSNASAPDGSQVYHDGVLLKGVTEEGIQNTKVIEAAKYYLKTFAWGNDSWNDRGAIYNNSYFKVREIALSYNLPKSIVKRLHFQKMQVALQGRNLFYIWRTLQNLDPESTIGTTWLSQGIDEGSSAATRSYGFSVNLGF